jgi:hypothetical protein
MADETPRQLFGEAFSFHHRVELMLQADRETSRRAV